MDRVRIILRFPRRGFTLIQKSKGHKHAAWNGVTGGQAGEVRADDMMASKSPLCLRDCFILRMVTRELMAV